MVTLEEAKQYLRVDFEEDDEYIQNLIDSAERLVMDTGRIDEVELKANKAATRIAVLYTIGYLYEHREDPDMHSLTLMLRSILFGIRKEAF